MSAEEILKRALKKRETLLCEETNAVRMFDGSGDGLPGVTIDAYGEVWVVATQGEILSSDFLQALKKEKKPIYWKKLSQQEKQSPQLVAGSEICAPFLAAESGVKYEISMQSGYSQGIFLDQRENRNRVRERVSQGDAILNTFAYTGAFSVCAALSGANATTLDLSQPYLDWGKRNFSHNKLELDAHFWCKGDTFHWLERFAKKQRSFDGIVLDPPTFSRDAKGRVFRVEKDYTRLVELAAQCLKPKSWMLASTNCRKLSPIDFLQLVKKGVPRQSKIKLHPMPEEYRDKPFLLSAWIELP